MEPTSKKLVYSVRFDILFRQMDIRLGILYRKTRIAKAILSKHGTPPTKSSQVHALQVYYHTKTMPHKYYQYLFIEEQIDAWNF